MRSILIALLLSNSVNIFSQVVLERDINQEPASSNPFVFTQLHDVLYFRADDGIHGEELYNYNIATETANLVADLKPLNENAGISETITLGNKIYFNGRDGSSSTEYLIVHDPETNETKRLFDQEGESVRDPRNLFVFDDALYFSADFGNMGEELGRYNPESNEVELLADINPEGGDSNPWSFISVNGELWFLAKDENEVNKLWKFDFTNNVPKEIIYTSESGLLPSIGQLYFFDNKLFFIGFIQGLGTELWIYDVPSNTILDFPEIYPGAGSSRPSSFIELEGKLYFAAANVSERRELRVYNPVTNKVTLVVDINENGDSNPGDIFVIEDKLYFVASEDGEERKLFSYQPLNDVLTEEATLDNNGFSTYLSPLIVANDILYLSGINPEIGAELLKFIPGNSELEIAADINKTTIGSSPYQFTEYKGKLYFGADEFNTGREVWVYDPANGNVDILSDLPGNTAPYNFTVLEEKLFFSGVYPELGYGLLFFDVLNGDIKPTPYITPSSTGHITDITAYNGKLYFKASDELMGNELHVFDPMDNSIQVLVDLLPGEDDGNPEKFFVFENELFFQANNGVSGMELWKYNSTLDAVDLVADINPGEDDSYPENFTEFNGKLFFSAYEDNTSYELYSYDPISGETTRRTDISGNLNPSNLTVYKGRLLMNGRLSSSINNELLFFDDLTDELGLAADINPVGASGPRDLVVFNEKLYFSADTDEYGREIWEYNDTMASIVADIYPGIPGSDASELTLFNGKLYFSANDGIKGAELWSIAECLNIFVDTEPNMGAAQGGSIDLTIMGGTPPYSISWSNGGTTEDLENLESGSYTAVVSDASGCLSEIIVEVLQVIDEDMDGFTSEEDCDDTNATINPGADEIPNNDIDENCDGTALIIDEDMDGFNSNVDCDDTNAAINPGAEEIANNGIDENCDGEDLVSSTNDLKTLGINIYPNPADEFVIVQTNEMVNFKLKIYDVSGKMRYDGANENAVNIQNWEPAIYFVKIWLTDVSEPLIYKLGIIR